MLDAAIAADQANRLHDVMLRQARSRPPPQKRERRPRNRTANSELIGNSNVDTDTTARRSAQKAIAVAAVRLGRLEHQVRLLHAIGQHDAARRFQVIAAGLHEVLA